MLRTLTVSLRATAIERGTWVTVAAVCGLALATALAAQVRLHLPFSPVPVTLQTFVVLLGGAILGARAAVAGQVLYLGLGVAGAPVFAGGPTLLTIPTAGYLAAFPVAAWIVGVAAARESRTALPLGLLAATTLIYLFGSAWLAAWTGQPFAKALALGALPFIPGDLMKLVAVMGLARLGRKGFLACRGE
ncbi:MAG: biotin transporter BioY [Armatimonadetes bacterium]|nr:biotin transporter BioY [Armatimonadota bacterium]